MSISLELHVRSSPISCVCYLLPWLGPPVAALRYVMYFRFHGWRHVIFAHTYARNRRRNRDSVGSSMDLTPCRILKLTHQGQHRTGGRVWYFGLRCSIWFPLSSAQLQFTGSDDTQAKYKLVRRILPPTMMKQLPESLLYSMSVENRRRSKR